MSRDTAPSPDTAVPEVPTASDEAHGLVNALSHNAAEWGASMHTAWFDRKEAAEDSLLDFIASLESRSLSSGRGVYVPREAISDVMLRLRYLANRIYGQQVANDEFASIIADLAALTPPTGDRK
jgi:hypothetical protein